MTKKKRKKKRKKPLNQVPTSKTKNHKGGNWKAPGSWERHLGCWRRSRGRVLPAHLGQPEQDLAGWLCSGVVSAPTEPVSGGSVWLAGSRGRGSLVQEGASDWLVQWKKVSQVTRYAAIRRNPLSPTLFPHHSLQHLQALWSDRAPTGCRPTRSDGGEEPWP